MGSLGLLVRGGPKQSLTKHAFIFLLGGGGGGGGKRIFNFFCGKGPPLPKNFGVG